MTQRHRRTQCIPHPDADRVAEAVRHHHEHFNGSGYPDGLKGEAIPICSRILSVVDSFDAMTTHRSYHRMRSVDEARSIMQTEAGTKLDPDVLHCFFALKSSVHLHS